MLLSATEHPPHANIGYGEIPKSCTMDNRQNLVEHQIYATIQRKQPPMPPFGAAASSQHFHLQQQHAQQSPAAAAAAAAGQKATLSGTLDRLKMLKPRRSVSHPAPDGGGGGAGDAAEICPYASSAAGANSRLHHLPHLHHNDLRSAVTPGVSRCATLGRVKTLEMTEYQKDKLLNEANTVKIRVSEILLINFNHYWLQ